MVTLYTSELSYPPMTTITILAMLAILSALATLSLSGFTVINTVVAQMADNATMGNLTVGNMTGGNASEGNTTGSISALPPA
jgi:hypothetical protein